jgi:formamidopyrimidine-DNA glycosylase
LVSLPELPDIVVYIEALEQRIIGQRLDGVRVRGPFLLRTVVPPLETAAGRRVERLRRIGKRIAVGLDGDLWLVLHLMIAGRLHWRKRGAGLAAKQTLAAFDFPDGTLLLTEAGSERRAGLHVVQGEAGLKELHSGGLEPLETDYAEFAARLRLRNHTLKRALTDPHLFSGIGNAYSDEILHAARLSPVALTQRLTDEEAARLFLAVRETLLLWVERLRSEAAGRFPEKVTAFRPDMAVHGRYKLPCPVCGTAVQRIRYASNETNYCPRCQTAGRLLADRSLSRLLKQDWPRRIDDIE